MNVAVVTTTPSTAGQRFAGLEGLRTLGLVAVFLTHSGFATGVTMGSFWNVEVFGSAFRPTKLLGHLEIGPAIFFMISAFLLYRPFAAAMYQNRELPSVVSFLRRRAVRVFPGYWVAIAVLFSTHSISARSPLHFVKIASLTHIYTQDDFFANRTLVPTWTLATELVFYGFLVLYATTMRRGVFASPGARLRRELMVLAGLCAVALGWRYFIYHQSTLPEVAEFWFPGTLDVFAVGLGLAAIDGYARAGGSIARWDRLANRADLWALAGFAFYLAVPLLTDASPGITATHGVSAYARNAFHLLCAFSLLVPVVFGDQSRGLYRRFVRLRPMAYLGAVSYGFYLWHDHWIVQAVHWSGGREALVGHFWLVGVAAFALSFLSGVVSYHWLERPALDLDLRRSRQRTGTAS